MTSLFENLKWCVWWRPLLEWDGWKTGPIGPLTGTQIRWLRSPMVDTVNLMFRWMIDWATDSDLTSITTGLRWIIDSGWQAEWTGEPNSDGDVRTTGLRWRIEWASESDSDPKSITTVFRWMIEWADRIRWRLVSDGSQTVLRLISHWDGEPNQVRWRSDWILMEDRMGRWLGPEFEDQYCQFPMDDGLGRWLRPGGPGGPANSMTRLLVRWMIDSGWAWAARQADKKRWWPTAQADKKGPGGQKRMMSNLLSPANLMRARPAGDDRILTEERLGRQMWPCRIGWLLLMIFRCMIYWAADSDPNSMTTGFRWRGPCRWTTGFGWPLRHFADAW